MSIISQESLEIVRATTPVVKENALKISNTFYPKMLGRHPELYKYFNESNQRSHRQAGAFSKLVSGEDTGTDKAMASSQSKTLADAVVAYALNIEKLENLSETVVRICHKHCALGITPEDYKYVHDNFMEAIGEVLGSAVTPEVAAAWSEAIMALANIFINQEKQYYAEAAKAQWDGVKEFVLSEIIVETPEVKSFRMTAADGMKTCQFTPGQYITVFEKPKDKEYFAPRHYTVTSQPGDDFYQISVKKLKDPNQPEEKSHDGFTSHYLHSLKVGDTVKLGPVFGPELLSNGNKSKVAVFVSIGIGITPTVALLPTGIKDRPRVAVFHGDSKAVNHPFRKHMEETVPGSNGGNGVLSVSYSHPDEADDTSPHYSAGRLTGEKIVDTLEDTGVDAKHGADYYICAGPTATPAIVEQLRGLKVDNDSLHLEYFGPFKSV